MPTQNPLLQYIERQSKPVSQRGVACVLPILIGSLVFYRAAKRSLGRYRMY